MTRVLFRRAESPPALLDVARSTVDVINGAVGWASGGGVDMMWPQASRVAVDGAEGAALLLRYTHLVHAKSHRNGYTDLGGGGLESIGGMDGSESS